MLCFLLFFCYSVQNTSFQPSGTARKIFHQSRNKAKVKPLHCLQRNPYTAQNVGKTIHCKTENVLENIITDTVKRTKSRKINEGNIDYPQVLVIQRRFCQLQTNSPILLQKTLVIGDFFEQAEYMLIITFFLVQ